MTNRLIIHLDLKFRLSGIFLENKLLITETNTIPQIKKAIRLYKYLELLEFVQIRGIFLPCFDCVVIENADIFVLCCVVYYGGGDVVP